ncbi:MAG: hypothetical protein EXR79_10825 [Myxococcales bacterium]|nr:hypothetical protein [Myxococcales bacterium]
MLVAAVAVPAIAAPKATLRATKADEALLMSKQALEFYLKGKHELASELYQKSFALDPKAEYAYGQGRADHELGRLESACTMYEKAITFLSEGDALYLKTQSWLEKARKLLADRATAPPPVAPRPDPKPPDPKPPDPEPKPRAPVAPSPAPALATVAQPAPPESTLRMPLGWGATGLGGVAIVAAAVLLSGASADQAELDRKKAIVDGKGKITGIAFDEAQQIETETNQRIVRGWVLGSTGAALVSVGVWLLATVPARAAVVPVVGPNHIALAWRF